MTDFKSLGLSDELLRAIETNGYDQPTAIQRDAIPLVLQGEDLMGLAQTGTGKTAAFGLPLAELLMSRKEKAPAKGCRALVLAPTRELVNQIAKNLISFIKGHPVRVVSIVGGVSINAQIKRMERGTDILVATPGRLLDLVDREAVRLDTASFLVLDEADQMLDLGFIHALRKIAAIIPKKRQTLLFSATMPKQIEDLARTYLKDPVRVEVAPAGKTADKITQCVHFVEQKAKTDFLIDMMSTDSDDISLVFCRTKHGAERLMKKLVASGFSAGSIHGNKSQNQRDRAIKGLREGDIKILVATDVAARGIDIPGVSHVYNFEMPEVPEAYVHRIGRTARAGADGDAIALCAPEEIGLFRQVEKLIGIQIEVASGDVPAASAAQSMRGGRGGKSGNSGRSNNKPKRARNKPGNNSGNNGGGKPAQAKQENNNRSRTANKRPKRRPQRERNAA